MGEMTSIERVQNTLEHQPVDRIAFSLSPWGPTLERWKSEGHLKENEEYNEHWFRKVSQWVLKQERVLKMQLQLHKRLGIK